METRLRGQSTLDECVEEHGHGSARRKRSVANLVRLCVVENLHLHISTMVLYSHGLGMAILIRTSSDSTYGCGNIGS